MLITQCPICGAAVLQDDQFCEECGGALKSIASTGCEKCGAPPDTIDPEGFCGQCGFRREAKAGDRVEVILNSSLAGVSDRGLKHHQNEDFLALQTLEKTEILVVCDGVSSSNRPELASQKASESMSLALAAALQTGVSPESAIQSAVGIALLEVCHLSDQSDTEPPSTTLVAAVVQDGVATIGWLGDSRAYWIAATGSCQLTQDHSWVNDAIASGKMTAAEANHSPQAHAITRWLGADAKEDGAPAIVRFSLPGAGYVLLCSDGLWNYLPEVQQIQALMQKSLGMDAITIARSLVEFARSRGGHDNITVALLIRSE